MGTVGGILSSIGSLLYGLNPVADKLKVLDITDLQALSVKNTISLDPDILR